MFRKNLKLLTATALFAGFFAFSQAQAELVYENDAPATAKQIDERATMHDNLGASERVRVTQAAAAPVQVQMAAPVAAPPTAPMTAAVAPAPVAVVTLPQTLPASVNVVPSTPEATAAPAADPTANLNRSELLRRERVREEVKNEDILQERLEELRLQDEKRRADQIMGSNGAAKAAAGGEVALPQALYSPTPPTTQLVGAAAIAQATPTAALPASGVNPSLTETGQSSSQMALPASSGEHSKFSIGARAGIASMASHGDYTMNPKYAGGLAIALEATDNVAFEVGYTYAVTGIGIAPSSPYIQAIQAYQNYYGSVNTNTLNLNNNIFDVGVKLYLFGPDAAIRPFVGGGLTYSRGFINYDPSLVTAVQQYGYGGGQTLGGDYTLNEYMASLSAGLDVRVSKNVSVGITAKYYDVLSSDQNGNLNNVGFLNQSYLQAASNADKQYVGGSLAGANYYTLLAGVNLSF